MCGTNRYYPQSMAQSSENQPLDNSDDVNVDTLSTVIVESVINGQIIQKEVQVVVPTPEIDVTDNLPW